jgi:Mitochondrial carrier protein
MAAGGIGGFVGNPMDVCNVRMQADGRLPDAQRRNYKHVFDALIRMVRDEGFSSLGKGLIPNIQRAMLMTAGQVASYEEIKKQMLATKFFDDGFLTHCIASSCAGGIATLVTQPIDVLKTRIMMAGTGRYSGMMHCAIETVKGEGLYHLPVLYSSLSVPYVYVVIIQSRANSFCSILQVLLPYSKASYRVLQDCVPIQF